MRQKAFVFGRGDARADAKWPEIVAADPQRYPGLLQNLAQTALHRLSRPHPQQDCPLCKVERSESAA